MRWGSYMALAHSLLFVWYWAKGRLALGANFQNDTLYFLMPENRLFRNRAGGSWKNQHVFM